ncbi:hypothetical protein DMC14_000080 [Metamycoplasma phocicerebrale]|uniref:Uncharacterized protein n=1 Tax=Metamycoplasma phocicerebrale TaxID=142649 RepID=A0A3Q9VBA7_9BACT|nr:hypothetical protein [Metamycoplasma phocicerebrale]AZZ65214.1 hypothetical protein DMC14_000080 [Metamycoplasma phocicerebrale]
MLTKFSLLECIKILIGLNLSKKENKDIKIQLYLYFGILVEIFLCLILFLDALTYYFIKFNILKEINIVFFGIKLFLLTSFYLSATLIINNFLAKKIANLNSDSIKYLNFEGSYIIYCLLNKIKINKIISLNKVINNILFIFYFSFSFLPFLKLTEIELFKQLSWLAIFLILKIFLFDIIGSIFSYFNIFKKTDKLKINAELSNYINRLVLYIFIFFYIFLLLIIDYFWIFYNASGDWNSLILLYAAYCSIPLFYLINLITIIVVYRKEKSKLKYLLSFIPLFFFPLKSFKSF